MINVKTYEDGYKDRKRFSFGRNWQSFLMTLNNERIEEAKKSLVKFLGDEDKIKNKTFVDVGCGSGLFSLAAYLLGAKEVVSVDVDEFSVSCANFLKEKNNNPENWQVKQGSALDENFIMSLGQFDIVYSWGVLHHTGDMKKALKNVAGLMDEGGLFYLAIYNKYSKIFKGGTSKTWLLIKRTYNDSGYIIKKIIEFIFALYSICMMIVRFQNPYRYINNYKSSRGMSWHYDLIDWVGGYPYEFASVSEITDFFGANGIGVIKVGEVDGLGCNEFILKSKR